MQRGTGGSSRWPWNGVRLAILVNAARRVSARGPLLTFAHAGFAHRGRRCPRGAHAVAVGAVRRLHCDARTRVVPQNSLRDLRSLRSNSRGKSVHEARWGAPTLALRFSSPQKSPPAGSTCREVHPWFVSPRMPPLVQQRHARAGVGAPLRCREAQGSWPRAQRASSSDSSTLSERSDRRSRSEFGDGAMRPSIAGESVRSTDRRGEAPQPARACLCRAHRNPHSRRRKSAKGRAVSHATLLETRFIDGRRRAASHGLRIGLSRDNPQP